MSNDSFMSGAVANDMMDIVADYLDSVTVVGGMPEAGGDPIPCGTGTFLRVGDARLVVTAGHVIKKIREEYGNRLVVWAIIARKEDGMRQVQPYSVNGSTYESPELEDVGVIEITSPLAPELKAVRFTHLSDTVLGPDLVGGGFICGFPNEYYSQPRPGTHVLEPLVLLTSLLPGSPDGLLNFDPKLHFVADVASDNIVMGDESPASLPRYYYGISGCAIWQTLWPKVDSPQKWNSRRVRIVGVQTGHHRSKSWLKATRWKAVIETIYNMLPHLRDVVRLHYPV